MSFLKATETIAQFPMIRIQKLKQVKRSILNVNEGKRKQRNRQESLGRISQKGKEGKKVDPFLFLLWNFSLSEFNDNQSINQYLLVMTSALESRPPPSSAKLVTIRGLSNGIPKSLQPFDTSAIKVLLLENVNETAVRHLTNAGYQVQHFTRALSEQDLKEKIQDVHVIGIRSVMENPT